MNKHIRLIPALALGMALSSIPTLATAATTINVVDQASLLAKGAGALVSVEVTCDPSFGSGSQLFANVSLIQRAGNSIIQGSGGISDTARPRRSKSLYQPPKNHSARVRPSRKLQKPFATRSSISASPHKSRKRSNSFDNKGNWREGVIARYHLLTQLLLKRAIQLTQVDTRYSSVPGGGPTTSRG